MAVKALSKQVEITGVSGSSSKTEKIGTVPNGKVWRVVSYSFLAAAEDASSDSIAGIYIGDPNTSIKRNRPIAAVIHEEEGTRFIQVNGSCPDFFYLTQGDILFAYIWYTSSSENMDGSFYVSLLEQDL